jgi:eukaryotic-like serine/threonine-protein kinase
VSSEAPQTSEKRKRCPACSAEFSGTLVVCKHDGTLLIPIRNDSLIGTYFAEKYMIESEIGRGGMSIVYKANHELMDRTVAIKMLQGQLVNDQNSILRFQQEAKAASCLTHPNVVTVYDSGTAPNGQPYLVMDYLVGESLSDLIRRENHLDVLRTLSIFIQVCDALEHAHQKGVLHRDLKASNIMLVSPN